MINNFREHMPQPLIGLGHSIGAAQMYVAVTHFLPPCPHSPDRSCKYPVANRPVPHAEPTSPSCTLPSSAVLSSSNPPSTHASPRPTANCSAAARYGGEKSGPRGLKPKQRSGKTQCTKHGTRER